MNIQSFIVSHQLKYQ